MKLSLHQLEAYLWGAANILRSKTAISDVPQCALMYSKML
jgi:hypothetical protein